MIYTLVRRDSENNIDSILSFDCITSFDESWAATVTTQTVEYGFDVTDNINIEAPTYSIDAIISSYSLFRKDREIVWDSETFVTADEGDLNGHITARNELIRIFSDRSILTLIESSANSDNENLEAKFTEIISGYYKETPNCVITSLSISQPSASDGAFFVNMKVQKINVAKVSTMQLAKEEMSPLLRGLIVTSTTKASKTKELDGDDVLDETVAAQDGETKTEATTGATTGATTDGDWWDVNDTKVAERKVYRNEIKAQKDMNEHMAKTGEFCELFRRSDGFYRQCRPTR